MKLKIFREQSKRHQKKWKQGKKKNLKGNTETAFRNHKERHWQQNK